MFLNGPLPLFLIRVNQIQMLRNEGGEDVSFHTRFMSAGMRCERGPPRPALRSVCVYLCG